jgi:hypothetical protein
MAEDAAVNSVKTWKMNTDGSGSPQLVSDNCGFFYENPKGKYLLTEDPLPIRARN